MTTISEELVRLEEAREKATPSPVTADSMPSQLECQKHGDWIMMRHKDWEVYRLARNFPVNFRKLGELVESAWELFEDSPDEDRIMVEVDSAVWGRFCKAIRSLESGHE